MSKHSAKVAPSVTPISNALLFAEESTKKLKENIFDMKPENTQAVASIMEENNQCFNKLAAIAGQFNLCGIKGKPSKTEGFAQELATNFASNITKLTELSEEAMQCRSLPQLIGLNTKAMQYFYDSYIEEVMKFSNIMFGTKGMKFPIFNIAGKEVCEALGA